MHHTGEQVDPPYGWSQGIPGLLVLTAEPARRARLTRLTRAAMA